MGAYFVCDNCGIEAKARGYGSLGSAILPTDWYSRKFPKVGWKFACCIRCTEAISHQVEEEENNDGRDLCL